MQQKILSKKLINFQLIFHQIIKKFHQKSPINVAIWIQFKN